MARRAEKAQLALNLARGFATGAAATPSKGEVKLPTPPVNLTGTSGQIATLVWQIAAKENVLDKVQDELYQVIEVFKQHPELRRLATDPFVPSFVRVKMLQSVLQGSKETTEVTKRLLEALAEEHALKAILEVTAAYEELMLAHRKEVHCTVITAQPLDKLERAEFGKQAEKFLEPGFKLVMQEKVDKKLLGGFIIEFPDRLVDMSTAKKLSEFNNLVAKLEADLK